MYMLSEEKDKIDKAAFKLKMEEAYAINPSNDIKILLGELNGKFGTEEIYLGLIGRQPTCEHKS